jgi:NAD(P)-dependent dehydrogenase (short-subunit alcohol dehydrogenase family)
MRLDGKTAVVTGGGQGIGAAVARVLAGAGAGIVVAGRTLAKVEGVAAGLRQQGRTAWALECDVTDPASVTRLAEEAIQRLGQVDILVNNAGVASSAPIARTTLEEWELLMRVNATGAFLCLKAFLPGMLERHWGRVINIASMAGLEGARYITAYTASKHALVGLTRAAAAEVAGHGVTVNAVCPAYVETPMTEATIENIVRRTGKSAAEAREAIVSTMPRRKLIAPEEVARAVLALAVDEAVGVNGQAVVLDGGERLVGPGRSSIRTASPAAGTTGCSRPPAVACSSWQARPRATRRAPSRVRDSRGSSARRSPTCSTCCARREGPARTLGG